MPLPLCCRIDSLDERSAEALKADGWREIEKLLTWRHTVTQHTDQRVQRGLPFHWKVSHTRLHKDPEVPDEISDSTRRAMMEDAAAKGTCLVIGSDAFVVFDRGRINFIGVSERARRRGLAKALVRHIGGEITAGTQDTNEAAKAFYRDGGFRVVKTERTFHK